MGIWKGICSCVGCVAAIGVCVASAGMATPFVAATAAPWVIGGGAVGGFFLGDKMDSENEEREKRLMEDRRYKDAENERNQVFKDNQNNQNLLLQLVGKRNGNVPRKEGETDESLDAQIAVVTNNLKNGEARLAELDGQLDKLRKELLGGFNLMKMIGLDKLKTMDQIMLIGGVVLLIVLLKK